MNIQSFAVLFLFAFLKGSLLFSQTFVTNVPARKQTSLNEKWQVIIDPTDCGIDSMIGLLAGTWYQERRCGSFAGECITPTDVIKVEFEHPVAFEDSVICTMFINDTLKGNRTYQVLYSESLLSDGKQWMLFNINTIRYPIHFNDEKLYVSEDVYDGYGYTYSRTNPIENLENGMSNDTDVRIYPNPCSDYFLINGIESIEKVELFDSRGRLIMSRKTGSNEVSVSHLSDGIYCVRVTSQHKEVSIKIIKTQNK